MDIRIEKTKSAIKNAFLELRSARPLEKITIKELCERAKINKSTFYAHYKDIYDLSEQMENEVVMSIIKAVPNPEKIFEDPAKFTMNLFYAYMGSDSLINILFSGNRRGELTQKTEANLRKVILEHHPDIKDDLFINVILSYTIFGGYYAFEENRHYGDEEVISSIAAITEQCLRMDEEI